MVQGDLGEAMDKDNPERWIMEEQADRLAQKMVDHFLNVSNGEDFMITDPEIFWADNGYSRFEACSKEVKDKMIEVEKMAEEKIQQIRKERRQKQEDEETLKLPEVINDCITWMQKNSFGKKLTRKYLSLFLENNDYHFMDITKERLYVKCNEELRRK